LGLTNLIIEVKQLTPEKDSEEDINHTTLDKAENNHFQLCFL